MKLGIANETGWRKPVAKIRDEALFELQVEAFLLGVAEAMPEKAEYGVSREAASRIVGRASGRAA
jgi:hypothetical protein